MEAKLKLESVSKSYDSSEAVKNISFTVYNEEFFSILGPSGCGKSTILRLIIGILQPDSGKIIKDEIEITNIHPSKRGMGIVFQNYALFRNMSVLDNVMYALNMRRDSKKKSKDTAMQILSTMGMENEIHKKPDELSGGQQQRTAIARTLALNPEIILFDEPMSALDAATRITLRGEIKRIKELYKSTIIYVTHDQEEALEVSDRIMVMHDGNIVRLDTPFNIINNPENDYVKEFIVKNVRLKMDLLARLGLENGS